MSALQVAVSQVSSPAAQQAFAQRWKHCSTTRRSERGELQHPPWRSELQYLAIVQTRAARHGQNALGLPVEPDCRSRRPGLARPGDAVGTRIAPEPSSSRHGPGSAMASSSTPAGHQIHGAVIICRPELAGIRVQRTGGTRLRIAAGCIIAHRDAPPADCCRHHTCSRRRGQAVGALVSSGRSTLVTAIKARASGVAAAPVATLVRQQGRRRSLALLKLGDRAAQVAHLPYPRQMLKQLRRLVPIA